MGVADTTWDIPPTDIPGPISAEGEAAGTLAPESRSLHPNSSRRDCRQRGSVASLTSSSEDLPGGEAGANGSGRIRMSVCADSGVDRFPCVQG
jgi:hypothetical protein